MEAGAGGGEPSTPRSRTLPCKVRLQLFCLEVVAGGLSVSRDGTINRSIFNLFDLRARASARPDRQGVRSTDMDVDASRGLWARACSGRRRRRPRRRSPSWCTSPAAPSRCSPRPRTSMTPCAAGSAASWAPSSCPSTTASPPEHRYPAAYKDGVDVLRHLASAGLPDGVDDVPVDLSRGFLAGGQRRRQHRPPRGAALDDGQCRVIILPAAF
jgi:hypothetical protein